MHRDEPSLFAHSVPTAAWLSAEVKAQYGLHVDSCRYLSGGATDRFVLATQSGRNLIARIDRRGVRSDEEVTFELDFLDYLAMRGGHVSRALRTLSDSRMFLMRCAEGDRRVVLTDMPSGKPVDRSESHAAAALAESVARLHLIATDYCAEVAANSPDAFLNGPRLGKRELLHQPLEYLRAVCSEYPGVLEQLQDSGEQISSMINRLTTNNWPLALCHGNMRPATTSIDSASKIMFSGFENCGIGWPAYDLATIRWHSTGLDGYPDWHRFNETYQQYNRLPESQLQAIPLLVACRHLWGMGRRARLARQLGEGYISHDYLSRQITVIDSMLGEFNRVTGAD